MLSFHLPPLQIHPVTNDSLAHEIELCSIIQPSIWIQRNKDMKLNNRLTSSVSVILSGGAGTRLWPLSRETYPKPFIKLQDGQSFLQKTFIRAKTTIPHVEEILTVTHNNLYFHVQNEYNHHSAGCKTSYLLEPQARNTGPAIVSAVLYLKNYYPPNTVIFILPSDHLINDVAVLSRANEKAAIIAQKGYLVTFGIKPTHPETGYGYIEISSQESLFPSTDDSSVFSFIGKRFTEKPDINTAFNYLNSKTHFWNSGMFCFTIETFLNEMANCAPDLLHHVKQSFAASFLSQSSSDTCFQLDANTYSQIPNISIDYALMEKSKRLAVVVSDIGWSDIGSWAAMSDLVDTDDAGNHMNGRGVLHDTTDCYIHAEHRTIGTIGLNNLIIVDMPDALLIANRDRTQEVKQIVQGLKNKNDKTLEEHPIVYRPWGYYRVLEEGIGYKIKEVRVKTSAALSLQLHHHRNEHWIVIHGTAKVTNADRTFTLKKNESTFIPAGHQHRLENPDTEEELMIIEVQSGHYLGEDDIVRYDDLYGRVS